MNMFSNIHTLLLCASCALVLGLSAGGCSGKSETAADNGHNHDAHGHQEDDHAGHEEHGHAEGDHDHAEEDSELHLTEEMKKTAGIVVAAVQRGAITTDLSAPASIVPTQTGEAHVGTLLAGRITRLYADEGTAVHKGAALAELEAFGVAELQSDYLRALAEVERTQAELRRNEALEEERIGARRSLEEARSAWRQAVAVQNSIGAQLEAVGIAPEELGKGSPVTARVYLRAPVAGIVSRRLVALGEYLSVERDAFHIVQTATVWVDAQVQPDRATHLHTGETATVRNSRGERRTGTIIYIAPVVDSASRTVTVRLRIENRDNAFRPRSYATVEFSHSVQSAAFVVPRKALEMEGGDYFLYRETPDGAFERIAVAVGATTEQQAEITAGLEEGQRIAIDGVFYLKSMRKSGTLAEHHH